MFLSVLGQLPLFAAVIDPANEPPTWIVVLTGVSLVFAILLILILVINLQGAIFKSIDRKKEEKAAQPKQQGDAVKAPSSGNDNISLAAVSGGAGVAAGAVPPEVVAIIAAAVAAAEEEAEGMAPAGTKAARGMNAAPKSRRGAWGNAGIVQSTEPF